jgi:hypothetical protein
VTPFAGTVGQFGTMGIRHRGQIEEQLEADTTVNVVDDAI